MAPSTRRCSLRRRRCSSRSSPSSSSLVLLLSLLVVALTSSRALAQFPGSSNGNAGPGGAISSLFRSLAGSSNSNDNNKDNNNDVAPAASGFSSGLGPPVTTDNSLASGKDPPLARSDSFQSSANAGKLLGGGAFPETGDPTTGNQVPVPATLSSKAQTAAPAGWVPPASGQLSPRATDYDAESSTLSAAQAKTNNVLNGVTVGAKAEAKQQGEEEEIVRGGTTSALSAAASALAASSSSPKASSPSSSSSSSSLDATGTKSFKSAKPEQLAKIVAPAGPNSQASSWRNASQPQPAPGVVPTLRSRDQNIAAMDAAQGLAPVPATSVLSDGSIAGGNANYGKQVDVSIVANLSYPGTGLKGEKVTVCHFPSPTFQGTGADPYTVKPLYLPPPAADLLLGSAAGNGFDFAAPAPGSSVFGPGCVSYDSRCSFGYNGIPCSGHGLCQSTLPNSCLCASGWDSCGIPGSNGCETNTNRDVNNCGKCGNKCPGSDDPTKNIGCCGGKCYDLNGDGGPTLACGRCGQPCQTSNGAASCTGGTCSLACNAGYSSCNATSLTNVLNLNVPICVDTTVNPLFCGGCNSRCPFDRYGATTCGQFGDGVNATAASCKVTCSPSYPTQCGTISNYNASSATRPPTSNCANTNQDVNNCGGCGIRCPQAPGSVSSCAISSVTGKPACFTTCSFGLTPCVLGATRFSACIDIYGLDNFNCGDCNVQCAAGEQCFYGSCFPIGSFGFAEFGFSAFAQQQKKLASSSGGLDSVSALEGNLTAEGFVPLPGSQLTDGLPAWGKLRNGSGGGNGTSNYGGWWRRRRRRGTKHNSSSSGLVGAGGGGGNMKPPNYDDDAEFYDDLTAIIEPYRAYMDLRPVEMRPELLSAAPSSVARGGSGGGLVGASGKPGSSSPSSAPVVGDVALFPSYNPKLMAAMPSSSGAGSSLLDGAPGALVNPVAAARYAAYLKAHPELTSREGVLVAGETVLEQLGSPAASAAASSARKARRKARYEAARSAELAAQKQREASGGSGSGIGIGGGGGVKSSPFESFASSSSSSNSDPALGIVAGALSSTVQGTPEGGTLTASAKADVCAPPEYTGPQPVVFARAVARPSAPAMTEAPAPKTPTKKKPAPSPAPSPSLSPSPTDPAPSADELARAKSDLSGVSASNSNPVGGFIDDQGIAGGVAPLLGADDPTQSDGGGAFGGTNAAGGGSTKPPSVSAPPSSFQQQQREGSSDEDVDPQVAAQQEMAAILAHELEAAAEGRGLRADAERQEEEKEEQAAAAAKAARAAAAAAPAAAAPIAPAVKPGAAAGTGNSGVLTGGPASTASVADATTAAAARKEADAAATAAAAAERAGPAARRDSGSASASKAASTPSSSFSSFPKDVSAPAGGNGAQIG